MKKVLLLTVALALTFGFAWADVVDNNTVVLSTATNLSKANISESANSPKATGTVVNVDMRSTDVQHRTVGTPIETKPTQGVALDVPPNDLCTNCDVLVGTSGTQDGTCIEATVDCPAMNSNECVWYCLTVPYAENDVEIDFCKTWTELAGDIWTIWPVLFEACSCDTLDIIGPDFFAWGEDPACNYQPIYRYYALPGPATYYLPVYALDNSDALMAFRFDYDVTDAYVPPQGDNCADPFIITSLPYTDDTHSTADFRHDHGYSGEDVVYQFILTECKIMTISLCNTDPVFDTYLWLMDDCGVSAIATDDDWCTAPAYGTSQITTRVEPGTYWILVDAYGGNNGPYVLDVTVEDCPPPCDYNDCTEIDYDSLLIDGGTLVYEGNNYGATLDPNCDSLTTAMSWIFFRTTEQLDVKLEFCGTDPVRTGYYRIFSPSCPCPPTGWVFATDENDTDCGDGNTTLYFNRLAAGSYWYPVIGEASEGPYLITLTAGPPTGYCEYTCSPTATPESEPCGTDINGGCNSDPPVWGAVACGEHICGTVWGDGGTRDTDWFLWTAPQDTMIIWRAAGSCPVDIIVMTVDDTCGTEYLGGNGIAECETTYVIATVDAGTDIAFFVSTSGIFSGYPCADGPTGDGFPYEAWLTCVSPSDGPPNDDCAYAIEIGDVTDYVFDNVGATTDNNGDCHSDLQSDIWYRYTASCDGQVTVSLCDATTYDAFLGIFTDDCVNHTCITWDDDGCGVGGGPSIASFDATSGQTYLVCIGGWAGGMGYGEFDIWCIPPPVIRVEPSSVEGTAPENGMDTEILNVYNDGGLPLEFDITVEQNTGAPFSSTGIQKHVTNTEPETFNSSPYGNHRKAIPAEFKSLPNGPVELTAKNNIHPVPNPVNLNVNIDNNGMATDTQLDCALFSIIGYAGFLGPFTGQEEFAHFLDPATCLDPPTYPYQVDSVEFAIANQDDDGADDTLWFGAAIYEADMTVPACPVPGDLIMTTYEYFVVMPEGYYGIWTLPMPALTCVTGPFFMSVVMTQAQNGIGIGVGLAGPDPCLSQYNDGSGWINFYPDPVPTYQMCEFYGAYGRTQTCEEEPCIIECPGEGIAEAEVCGDDDNNGCWLDPPVFEPIAWNTVVCGTGWSTPADTAGMYTRDGDWYSFSTGGLTNFDLRCESEFPTEMWLLEWTGDCDSLMGWGVWSPFPCDELRISGVIDEGDWLILVLVESDSVLCDETGKYGIDYNLSLDAEIAWLYTDIDEGVVVAPGPVPVEVTMDATQLTVGHYYGNIIFDSNDPVTPTETIPVHFEVTPGVTDFEYLPGDVNMSLGVWPPRAIGGDVTFLVNYYKGMPSSVPCLMHNSAAGTPYFWAAADANGDCITMGGDVVYMVNYFSGGPVISYCVDYPPRWLTTGDAEADGMPIGWPNCQTPPVTGSKIIPTQSK